MTDLEREVSAQLITTAFLLSTSQPGSVEEANYRGKIIGLRFRLWEVDYDWSERFSADIRAVIAGCKKY